MRCPRCRKRSSSGSRCSRSSVRPIRCIAASWRASARAKNAEQKETDQNEARRAFGEIVEFAADDPLARRRLGDLLRAHGWFREAQRQYQTLARLSPDDPSVSLLLAAA